MNHLVTAVLGLKMLTLRLVFSENPTLRNGGNSLGGWQELGSYDSLGS